MQGNVVPGVLCTVLKLQGAVLSPRTPLSINIWYKNLPPEQRGHKKPCGFTTVVVQCILGTMY